MNRAQLLEKIAPCSLLCHTCGAYKNGLICKTASQLFKYMDGVKEFYEKHNPSQVEKFIIFYENLENYSKGSCPGCRNGEHCGCSIKGCFILKCTMEHNVDFCGECEEFPCNKTNILFDDEVYKQWLCGNQAIQREGIEVFWEENCRNPHYKVYKHF